MTGREIRVSEAAALTRWNFVSEAVTEAFFSSNKIIASSWPQQRSRKAEQSQCLTLMVLGTFDLHRQLATVSTLFVRHEVRQSSQQTRHGPNSTDCLHQRQLSSWYYKWERQDKMSKDMALDTSFTFWIWGLYKLLCHIFISAIMRIISLTTLGFFLIRQIFIVCPQTNCKQDLWKEYAILCTSCPRWK